MHVLVVTLLSWVSRGFPSQGIDEIRSLVAELIDLFLGLALHPDISLTVAPFGVFSAEQQVLDDAASKKPRSFVGKDHGVAGLEAWFVFGSVYVAGDDSVQIAPTNHKSERDTYPNVSQALTIQSTFFLPRL